MTLESDIAQIKLQEKRLQFKTLTEDDAWALGSAMRALAAQQKLPLAMDIRVGQKPLFACAMPGTSADNADWIRRKINTVYRFEAASYRIALEHQKTGKVFDVARGVDPLHHALAGGGFPIRLGGVVVGVVTVSGVPQRDDHAFVVEALAAHLGVPHGEVALPPESA